MTLAERVLLHQVHPAKLAADIGAAAVPLYFFWQHQLWLGLITYFAPPVIASGLLLHYARLEGYAASPVGNYLGRYITRTVEAVRFAGHLAMVLGAWLHRPWVIALGLAVIAVAWANGLIQALLRMTLLPA
jgi:hypothetical protein